MSSRPSHLQMKKLVEFLEKNPGIAKGHIRSAQARYLTKQKWAEITLSLNCLGGATKDAKSWTKFWTDKKYALKKIIAQRNVSQSRTGGGIDSLPSLADLEERLVSVMGGSSFADAPKRSPRPRRFRLTQQSQLQTERQRLIRIEEKRVEAEVARAEGWKNLVQSMDNIANPINIGADKIAQALQN